MPRLLSLLARRLSNPTLGLGDKQAQPVGARDAGRSRLKRTDMLLSIGIQV
jgi:hypothetical protein